MDRIVKLKNNDGEIYIEIENDSIFIKRKISRNGIINSIGFFEHIDEEGNTTVKKLTIDVCNIILDRIEGGEDYASSFIFYDGKFKNEYNFVTSEMEHKFTSTGIKFWNHSNQMLSYKTGGSNTIISTHVSPEGSCNLKCPYCSVTQRNTHSRIGLEVIQDYIEKLQTRGLKAVILTGGGEPTSYKYINELVNWLKYDRNLSVALITNGTLSNRLNPKSWQAFSWVRVSINLFDGWQDRISIPMEFLDKDCIVGASMVFTIEHQSFSEKYIDRLEMLRKVSDLTSKFNAKYIRILPNCLLNQNNLILIHNSINKILVELNDPRFFHQHKLHSAPKCSTCHQSYFRPYLSEEIFIENGEPGAVYPCDSIVLNNVNERFSSKYQLCHAKDILDYLDKKIKAKFNPTVDCKGCVFTSNVNMLDDWKNGKIDKFNEPKVDINHDEFV